MDTRKVYWKGKFGGRVVTINAADFNPDIHSDTPWKGAEDPRKAREKELGAMKADEVKALAKERGVDAANKEEAIAAVLAAEFPSE